MRDYEPIWALDGGEDGLSFYRSIIQKWTGLLRPGGAIMFEVGEGQARDVRNMLLMAGLHDVLTVKDTRGVERVVKARA